MLSVANVTLLILLSAELIGCQNTQKKEQNDKSPPVVEVTMADYSFVAPDSIPSSWTIFKETIKGKEHHNFHLHLFPEGRTAEDFRTASDLTSPRTAW